VTLTTKLSATFLKIQKKEKNIGTRSPIKIDGEKDENMEENDQIATQEWRIIERHHQ